MGRASHEYSLATQLRSVRRIVESGRDVLNIGVGNPDLPPPPCVVRELINACADTEAHRYQPSSGLWELRDAFAQHYREHLSVSISADNVLPVAGAREGIYLLTQALCCDANDTVLVPSLGYPIYSEAAEMRGHCVKRYDVHQMFEDADVQRDICDSSEQATVAWINSPHMPTGRQAGERWITTLMDVCRAGECCIVNDNPYWHLFDMPFSILQLDGAIETCVELASLSKSHNMAGWRVGAVVAREEIIDKARALRSYLSNGIFYPTQRAAAAALSIHKSWYSDMRREYANRRFAINRLLRVLGCLAADGQQGMFVWAQIPETYETSVSFCESVLRNHGVFLACGDAFGLAGEGHVRASLCESVSRIEKFTMHVARARRSS